MPTSSSPTPAEPTLAATPTSTLMRPTEPPPTPTYTPLPPYPNKKVILNYYTGGDHSLFDLFFGLGFRADSRLVLYEDGLMILAGYPYTQKVLSPDQVERFFSKLEALGFYTLESNQKHDPTDKLYDYGNNYQKIYDDRAECIYANHGQERTLCAHESDVQFLVPRMKAILHYLDGYRPSDMTPYYPDRILLWVQERRTSSHTLPGTAIPWSDDLPALDSLPWGHFSPFLGVPREQISYFDGHTAKAIYVLVDDSPYGYKVVTQDGQEYIVNITVVLPHEELTNAYQ